MKIFYINIIFLLILSFIQCNKVTKNVRCENVKDIKEAADCFNTILDDNYETCCFFEFKKKDKYVRERNCLPLDLDQFLNISDTIKDIEKNNEDIKIFSLECDKGQFLYLKSFIMMFCILLILF